MGPGSPAEREMNPGYNRYRGLEWSHWAMVGIMTMMGSYISGDYMFIMILAHNRNNWNAT
jgi:hypothetical protein